MQRSLPTSAEAAPAAPAAPAWWRTLLPLGALFLAVATLRLCGFDGANAAHGLLGGLAALGHLAAPAFLIAFALGILLHVPGSLFVAAGTLAFGFHAALWLCFFGGLLGNVATFALVRCSSAPAALAARNHGARGRTLLRTFRSLRRLAHGSPFLFVLLVRLVFPTTAVANYLLGATGVAWRPFLLACLLGVWPQLLLTLGAFSWLWAT